MRKTKIEVICGFLEGGKTTLIQHMLENDLMEQYDSIVVLQCEEGMEELRAGTLVNKNVVQAEITELYKISGRLFSKIKWELNPDLILIEYNGTWPIENLLRARLPSDYYIDQILFCADATTFELYRNNTGELMAEQLNNSDAVLFNRCSGEHSILKQNVKGLNRKAKLFFEEAAADTYLYDTLKRADVTEQQVRHWELSGAVIFAILCLYLLAVKIPAATTTYSFLKSVNTVFIGVLLQAVPFLLLGVFVSSILQALVPDDRLASVFIKHPVLGFPLAVVLGVLFPVCDCAMVPITTRLIRKGVPLPQAITFMLASPAVNPVTFISTLYAFPGQREYAVYRLLLGVIISVIVGLILSIQKVKAEEVLTDNTIGSACSGGYMGSLHYKGALGTAEGIFRHAGMELLNVGRFIVCGALISSALQIALPASAFQGAGKNIVLPLLIMLLASFVMSVCSTSNAFIARSFLNSFPLPAIMGFVVMGPMLDLSNLFMLSSSFHKRFILKLVGILFLTGFLVLIVFSFLVRT
nr:permease [uncultured Caproiciproducens sp.]